MCCLLDWLGGTEWQVVPCLLVLKLPYFPKHSVQIFYGMRSTTQYCSWKKLFRFFTESQRIWFFFFRFFRVEISHTVVPKQSWADFFHPFTYFSCSAFSYNIILTQQERKYVFKPHHSKSTKESCFFPQAEFIKLTVWSLFQDMKPYNVFSNNSASQEEQYLIKDLGNHSSENKLRRTKEI